MLGDREGDMVDAGAPEGPQVTWGQITIENHGVGPADFQQVSLSVTWFACQVAENCTHKA